MAIATGVFTAAQAQLQLVADINQAPLLPADPENISDLNGIAILTMDDAVHGTEVWRSDGTNAGTYLLRDIWAGANDGLRVIARSPSLDERGVSGGGDLEPRFTRAGNTMFFVADDGIHGVELWATDGTVAGTRLVKDVRPGAQDGLSNDGQPFAVLGGILYFSADDANADAGIWRSDGTEAGTFQLMSFPDANFSPERFLAWNSAIYFSAHTIASGEELWRTDGTTPGTVLVKDANSGAAPSFPDELTPMGGHLYFTAVTNDEGRELWRTDGTEANTQMVMDIFPGTNSGYPYDLIAGTNRLYFKADDGVNGSEYWVSDGTPSGTVMFLDANAGSPGSYGGEMFCLPSGDLLFAVNAAPYGVELWRSDGTASGTELVKDINPSGDGYPYGFTLHNGNVLFAAVDDINGGEPWVTDGTLAGTQLLADIAPGMDPSASSIVGGQSLGGQFIFTAWNPTTGSELWSTDGTSAGTALLAETRPGAASGYPGQLAQVGASLFFRASDPVGVTARLWVTDGSTLNTRLIVPNSENTAGSYPGPFVEHNGHTYFMADDGIHGREVWITDGTTAGTAMVYDIDPTGDGAVTINGPTNGLLLLVGQEPGTGMELWATDGTGPGTTLVDDIVPGPGSSQPFQAVNAGGTMFFSNNTPGEGSELWRSDGTAAGTSLVIDLEPGPLGSGPSPMAAVNGQLIFSANTTDQDMELWASDGTVAGTIQLTNNSGFAFANALATLNGLFYFRLFDGFNYDVWRTDGTPAGTQPVDFLDQFDGNIGQMVMLGTQLIFIGGLANEADLWVSDGTIAGTSKVVDPVPGSTDAMGSLLVHNARVYFSGYGVGTGWELYRTDGTALGTELVADLAPSTADLFPLQMLEHDGAIYVTRATQSGMVDLLCIDEVAGTQMLAHTGTDIRLNGSMFSTVNGLFLTAEADGTGSELYRYVRPPSLRVKALLQGPYDPVTGLMGDALRAAGYIPLQEPNSALPWPHGAAGGETIAPAVLAVTGANAIVDWVRVELRSNSNPATVLHAANALIQRDGDVVGLDGVKALEIGQLGQPYHVALRHRNHFGVMTASPVALGLSTSVDFLVDATHGNNALTTVSGTKVMWAGNVLPDQELKYTGGGNDRDPILVRIGGSTPNNTAAGYWPEDATMNGLVQYVGAGNDRDIILLNIGSLVPTNVRPQQLP